MQRYRYPECLKKVKKCGILEKQMGQSVIDYKFNKIKIWVE